MVGAHRRWMAPRHLQWITVMLAAIAGVCLVAATFLSAWGYVRLHQQDRENCARLHDLTIALERIIIDSRASLEAYLDDGTITRVQYKRSLVDAEKARLRVVGADCPHRKVG